MGVRGQGLGVGAEGSGVRGEGLEAGGQGLGIRGYGLWVRGSGQGVCCKRMASEAHLGISKSSPFWVRGTKLWWH